MYLKRIRLSAAGNLGASIVGTDYVEFVDDDAVLPDDWIAKVHKVFEQHPEVLGVTGSVFPLWVDRSVSWFSRSLYWVIGCTAWRLEDRESLTWSVVDVIMIYRRKAFDTASFMDEFTDRFHKESKMDLSGYDNDFASRLILATGFKGTGRRSRSVLVQNRLF